MEKMRLLASIIALGTVLALSGCSGGQTTPATAVKDPEPAKQPQETSPVDKGPYQDGVYYAEDAMYGSGGWKYFASLTVSDGNIVAADWNGLNVNGGKDKDTLSADGEYGLVEKGKAQAEWHEQAEKAEAYLLKTQDPTKITYKDDAGHSDDIAGVSIHVVEFFDLAKAALDKGPIAQGSYKDGIYYAAEDAFKGGWKYMTSIVVKNGSIVGVDWNGISEDAAKPNKDVQSTNGDYKLAPGNQGEWAVQAQKAEAYLLKTQDPTKINYKDDAGHSDDIAGVSVTVGEFFKLAEKALEGAK